MSFTSILQVQALYNSCKVRESSSVHDWDSKILDVQNTFLATKGYHATSLERHLLVTSRHQKQLTNLREKIRDEITGPHSIIEDMDLSHNTDKLTDLEKSFCKSIQKISNSCCEMMSALTNSILNVSTEIAGLPPCSFEVVAIGSMARGEMTPYSDLEYLFLVQDSRHRDYFHTLAVISYFMIANLGETNLKYMNIKELKEMGYIDQQANGFKIDGLGQNAGNIPTGNGLSNSKQLILTEDELYDMYYKDYMASDDEHAYDRTIQSPSHIVGSDLSQMLSNCISVFKYPTISIASTVSVNDQSLLGKFHHRLQQLLMTDKRKERTIEMMKQDANKYTYLPTDFRNPSGWLKVKSDIYRYPTIMINSLKIFCEIHETNVWKSIDLLAEQLGWEAQTVHGIKFLVAASLLLRLDAYLFYNTQSEHITLLHQGTNSDSYKINFNLFHSIGSYLFTLKSSVQMVMQSDHIHKASFTKLDCRKDSKACYVTLAYCQQWEKCLAVYSKKQQFGRLDNIHGADESDIPVLTALEYCVYRTGNYVIATKISRIILQLYDNADSISQAEKADRLSCIASNLRYLTRYDQANRYYSISLKIYESMNRSSSEIKLATARTMNFVGRCMSDVGKYVKAQKNLEEALKVQIELLGDQHPHVGHTHNNLGNLFSRMADYEKAEHHHIRTLEIRMLIHGKHTDHHDIAIVQHNMADRYRDQGNFREAIELYERSLSIYQRLYSEKGHEEIWCIQHKLARCYSHDQNEGSISHVDDLLSMSGTMLEQAYKDNGIEHHPDVAEYHVNLATRKAQKGKRFEFEEHMGTALQMYKEVYGKKTPHINIVNCLLTSSAIAKYIFGDESARRSAYCKACWTLKRVFPGKINAQRRKLILARTKYMSPAPIP